MASFGSPSAGELVALCGQMEQGLSLSLGTAPRPQRRFWIPWATKPPLPGAICAQIQTYTFTRDCFFCRVWLDTSSTGSEIHFAMNRQVFLPLEEEVWEKEALPSPGPRGTYLSDPQRAPLMPSTTLTPPQHRLTRAGLLFLPGGWGFHCASHLPSRSTVWPSLLSYFISIY